MVTREMAGIFWHRSLARCLFALAGLGCSNVSCNKSPRSQNPPPDAGHAVTVEKITVNPSVSSTTIPLWLVALRERRWADAVRELALVNPQPPADPKIRLVYAYALARDANYDRALPMLVDLEKELPLLRSQVARLRAEALIHTNQAISGAAWLLTQGEPRGYVEAAQTLWSARQSDLALASAKRAIDLFTPMRDEASRGALAQARSIRAQILEAQGDSALAAQDWLWLATQVPLHTAAAGADRFWEKATGQKLTSEQRLQRALTFARAGMLLAVEQELELIQAISHQPIKPGYSDWLLGKARSKARVEHAEGAHMLERSVSARVEDADSIRLEAARLYMRAGQESESLRLLGVLLRAKSPRSREAQVLAARARRIMGDYAGALRIYDSLLGKDAPRVKDDLSFEQAVTAILAGYPARAVAALDALAQDERRETLHSRTAELAAVAALEANRRDDAISRFRAVINQFPFTLGAWLASVRLRQLGVSPNIGPIPSGAPTAPREISLEIPKNVVMLHELGLEDWAAKALNEQESVLRSRYGASVGEVLCDAYGLLGLADRRYAVSHEAVGNLDLTKLPDANSRWRWDCRYPRPYMGIVDALESQWQLPKGLTYAIMRQESGFREKVQSPVGAVGLTQLMPNTAQAVSQEFGAVEPCLQQDTLSLNEPRCNMELGARYMHKLYAAFDGQLPLVVLSYNAGPQAVNHWASEKGSIALDLFLAKVPFAETRNYVHHVLTNFLVYTWLDQSKDPLPELTWTPVASSIDPKELY
jgi:soluble lytic murein transglycosylase